jgi:uncharacterized membrane protein YcaP (DUF421 family)
MHAFGPVHWKEVFLPSVPVVELLVRGSVIYIALFSLLRFLLKRIAGAIGIADLLMVVLIADAAQNAMAADYKSVTDGIILVGTIIFWNFAFDWLGYRFPTFRRFVHPPPLPLVKEGRLLRRNMRHELISEDELMSHIRLQGASDLSQVKEACMEGDGRISVITYDSAPKGAPEQRAV